MAATRRSADPRRIRASYQTIRVSQRHGNRSTSPKERLVLVVSLDQDSGYDENWDVLFKVHLSNICKPSTWICHPPARPVDQPSGPQSCCKRDC